MAPALPPRLVCGVEPPGLQAATAQPDGDNAPPTETGREPCDLECILGASLPRLKEARVLTAEWPHPEAPRSPLSHPISVRHFTLPVPSGEADSVHLAFP